MKASLRRIHAYRSQRATLATHIELDEDELESEEDEEGGLQSHTRENEIAHASIQTESGCYTEPEYAVIVERVDMSMFVEMTTNEAYIVARMGMTS